MAIKRLLLTFAPLFGGQAFDGPAISSGLVVSRQSSEAKLASSTAPLSEAPVVIRDAEVKYSSLQINGDVYNGFNASFTQLDHSEASSSSTENSLNDGANGNTSVTYYSEQNNDASDIVPPYMQHMTLILVILHLSVFITGLVGNFLVCLSVYRNKSLQTVTNYYIVNLAVADFLVILICLPPTVYWDLTLTWNFGLVLCKMVLYFQSISVSVSVLTLTCISIDRWYAICRPLKFSSTKYRAKITILLIWIVSMLIASPDAIFLTTRPLHEENNYVYMDCTYSWPESTTKMYQLCIVSLLFIGPFVLMTISYSHIVNVLWRNETMADSLQHSLALEEEQQSLKRKKELLSSTGGYTTVGAVTTNQPSDIQVPTMRILTTQLDSPEAKDKLDNTSGSTPSTTTRQRGGTKPCSLPLRDLGGEKCSPAGCSCNNQHSFPSSNYSSEELACRGEEAGASRGGNMKVAAASAAAPEAAAKNKIAQANLPSMNVLVVASGCEQVKFATPIVNEVAAGEVERRINNIISDANQSNVGGALAYCATTEVDDVRVPSTATLGQFKRCSVKATNASNRYETLADCAGSELEDKTANTAMRGVKNEVEVRREQDGGRTKNRKTFEHHAGLKPFQDDPTSAALMESSDRVGSEKEGVEGVLVSGTKVAPYCSTSTGLTEAIFPKEDSGKLIVSSVCHKLEPVVDGRKNSRRKANSGDTLTAFRAENSVNPLNEVDSSERVGGIRIESKSTNGENFKVSYNKISSTSVYVNTTNVSRPERQVMNCNDEAPMTLNNEADVQRRSNFKEVKNTANKEDEVSQDERGCCRLLLKTMGYKEARLDKPDKTTKKYRKNLANYAAKKDRYREVVLTGRGTRQTLLLSEADGCEGKKEENIGTAAGRSNNRGHCQMSLNLGHSVKSSIVEINSPTVSCARSNNFPELQSESVNPRSSTGFNQHHPSNKTRFYKLIESRKKAAKMLIVIVIMFGLCYLPVHFLNILRYTIKLPQNDFTTIASLVSHWLCYFNSAVNPLIYNLMSGKFRHEFANLFFCKCLRRGNGN